ncbi:MAG: DNA repair protein RadC [Acholeplasmatales bacterium]|nr:DNA repair protein RadC [Acholeplasmatales bacterium]
MKMDLIEEENRPREKIIEKGPIYLSDSELLAIMLGYGTKDESIMDLSSRLIKEYSLKGMFNMNYNDLIKISGIKKAKATKLLATFEIARRAMNYQDEDISLNDSNDVFNYIKGEYILLKEEVLTVIYVNNTLKVIDKDKYTLYDSGMVDVPIKEIVANAINKKAKGIFIIHNHPGGSLNPSKNDINTTIELRDVLKALGMHLFDSIIISNDDYFSIDDYISRTNVLNNLKMNRK